MSQPNIRIQPLRYTSSSNSFFRMATEEELSLVHDKEYIQEVKTYSLDGQNPCKLPERWPTYVSEHVYGASTCAVGSLLNMVDSVCTNQVRRQPKCLLF